MVTAERGTRLEHERLPAAVLFVSLLIVKFIKR